MHRDPITQEAASQEPERLGVCRMTQDGAWRGTGGSEGHLSDRRKPFPKLPCWGVLAQSFPAQVRGPHSVF